MASMLEQYEQSRTRTANVGQQRSAMPEPVTSGFINARMEDETPIFNKQRINFRPPEPISHLVVCNSYLVMAMTSNTLLRIDLEHPEAPDEVEVLKGSEDKIHRIFLDPTGRHLLISMESGENYFLHRNTRKAKQLTKLKGHVIDSVGWNRHNQSDSTTSEILLGTSRGLIFETEIQAGDDSRFFQGSLDQYWKQLYNLGTKDKPTPVTGLEFDKMTLKSMNEKKYFIMATTPRRMYQFIGTISASTEPPIFQKIFQPYEDQLERFLDLPDSLERSELYFYHTKFRESPSSFAWMAGPGVYYGGIDVSGNAGQDTVTTNCKLIAYQRDEGEKQAVPLSIVLTEFHLLVLFPDRLKAMCVLNEQVIFDDAMTDRFGCLRGMCKDPLRGSIWAFTDQAVFKYKLTRESRDVWQIYLDKGDFALARQYCKDNPAHVDKVTVKEAEHLFKTKKFEESANLYAQTHNSFEEVALKFIQVEEKNALKTFLMKKLSSLSVQDKTQITMIVTWLIEIWLNQLGELREQGQEMSDTYDGVQDEFRMFLARNRVKECLMYNRNTVYDLIASHGDIDDMVYFAVLMQDYERVIEHHLQHDNYTEALKILTEQCKENQRLIYRYAPLLMQNVPKETVTACIQLGRKLDPKQLIPALVQYDHKKYRTQGNETIRYLEFCVETLKNSDVAIHNYLLSQYAKLQPERLMTYLHIQGEDPESVFYDLKYALRLCSEHDLKRACVKIYTTMGLYEEAVDLALKVDVDLAKENANKPSDDEELRKKLWLRIARHVVEEEEDIRRAMEFLNECDLLKIEDILPFFPDFVTIDHFKDAICTSLEQYNKHIERLKEEMDEATESAREIRSEIQTFRNKYAFIKAQDKCAACSFPLLTRNFYVFPCMHRFHTDCLVSEVLPHLLPTSRRRVEELQRKIASRDDGQASARDNTTDMRRDLAPKEELDEIVAAECILCGDYMIRCIDKPFIESEELESVMQSWL
ncbi:vacuolar protein sorting-associated protein 18 homolog [Lineus longissimus]|uniref:vacuolar protein sorting-associated protein 18 homolog n=1 Tax=Lineus longissimus TaxID=88925 RepID=UPI002B4C5420